MNGQKFLKLLSVALIGFGLSGCGDGDVPKGTSNPSKSPSGVNSSQQLFGPSIATKISYGSILDGVPISCDHFNPVAIKSLSEDTILWLAALQPSGLTLHENYYVARESGYAGAFGHGEHNAWLAQDYSRLALFQSSVQAMANSPQQGFGTFANHHLVRRVAGYRGLFLCGGDACFQQGQCDDLGRRF